MKARSIARELALFIFSQSVKTVKKVNKDTIDEIVAKSIKTLVGEAESNLKTSVGALFQIKEYIEQYEINHSDNTERSIDAAIIPVTIPMTSDMTGRIDEIINIAEQSFMALEISEIATSSQKKSIQDFSLAIIEQFNQHQETIDGQISNASKGWNIERLAKIDRDILRISIIEILYMDTPAKVAIDEAVEMAKKYSTEESSSFINGVLRKVYETNKKS